MALGMRGQCERCDAMLTRDGEAWMCVVGCTFCQARVGVLARVRSGCGGESRRRPRLAPQSETAVA